MKNITIKDCFQQLYAEAVNSVYDYLQKENYTDYYCDLHHNIFNTENYCGDFEITDTNDVFLGIEISITHQIENFGEICNVGGLEYLCTKQGLINYLWYMAGEEVITLLFEISQTFNEQWNEEATLENNKKICKDLKKEMQKSYIKNYL